MKENGRSDKGIQHCLFSVALCKTDLKKMCGRYHFRDTDLALLERVYKECLSQTPLSFYYIMKEKKAAVLLTLGQKADEEQNRLVEEGKLWEAYALDCLAMELLSKGYEKADMLLYEKTGMWCGPYRFPGSDCPIEENGAVIKALGQNEVSCNEAFVLSPKKSVIYLTHMQEVPFVKRREHLCTRCSFTNCPNRIQEEKEQEKIRERLNYGYQRIFGK